MGWLYLTIFSAITLSVTRVIQRVLLKNNESDSFAFSFIFSLFVSLIFLVYTLATNTFEFPNLFPSILNLVLMVLFYSLGGIFIYKAYKESPASEIAIIFASSSIWSVISAVLILGEEIQFKNILGVLTIITGIIVINYQKTAWKIERSHMYALVSALLFGVAFTNDALLTPYFHSIPSYLFIAFLYPSIATLLYRPQLIYKLSYFFSAKIIYKFLLVSTIYALAAISIYTAYQIGGKASVIIPINQTSIVITVILSYFFLGERDNLPKKIVGSLLAFIGVILLI